MLLSDRSVIRVNPDPNVRNSASRSFQFFITVMMASQAFKLGMETIWAVQRLSRGLGAPATGRFMTCRQIMVVETSA